jgi:hypothetical protein
MLSRYYTSATEIKWRRTQFLSIFRPWAEATARNAFSLFKVSYCSPTWSGRAGTNLCFFSSHIGRFVMYVGGNRSPQRKPRLSEIIALSITWGMGLTGNRTHDFRGDRLGTISPSKHVNVKFPANLTLPNWDPHSHVIQITSEYANGCKCRHSSACRTVIPLGAAHRGLVWMVQPSVSMPNPFSCIPQHFTRSQSLFRSVKSVSHSEIPDTSYSVTRNRHGQMRELTKCTQQMSLACDRRRSARRFVHMSLPADERIDFRWQRSK